MLGSSRRKPLIRSLAVANTLFLNFLASRTMCKVNLYHLQITQSRASSYRKRKWTKTLWNYLTCLTHSYLVLGKAFYERSALLSVIYLEIRSIYLVPKNAGLQQCLLIWHVLQWFLFKNLSTSVICPLVSSSI
jgi:hypothetical protein